MNSSEISLCVLPIQKIDSTATKVHGLSVSYTAGQKALVDKDCKPLPTSCLQKAAEEVSQFWHKMKSSNEKLLFVAHNGDKDFSQFLHKIKSNNEQLLLVVYNGHKEFSQFLHKMKSNNKQLFLVTYNGHTFDQNRFRNT